MKFMDHSPGSFTHCLVHQLPETHASLVGLVCPHCKRQLYADPPQGPCLAFWESQPGAYSLSHEPCFVYVLAWENMVIRSLHPAGSHDDFRGARARQQAARVEEANANPFDIDPEGWRDGLLGDDFVP
jgi:hypothetical protein